MAEYRSSVNPNRKPLHTLLPLDAPISLHIDSSDVCNFRCQFCFQHFSNIPHNIMSLDLFKKIVADMKNFPVPFDTVYLHGNGEPLLNKNFPEFVRILKNASFNANTTDERPLVARVAIISNASQLNEKLIHEIVDAGLDRIGISIYGLSDEDYEKFCGKKISFEKLKENIALLYQYGHSNGKHLDMYIKIAGEYFSEEQQQSFLDQFSSMADTIFVEHTANIWSGLKIPNAYKNGQYDIGTYDYICPTPFYQMKIHSDGLVSPCCVEWQKKLIIGDVKKQSLFDIWNSENLYNLRMATLKRDLKNYPTCANCKLPTDSLNIDLTSHIEKLLDIYEKKPT